MSKTQDIMNRLLPDTANVDAAITGMAAEHDNAAQAFQKYRDHQQQFNAELSRCVNFPVVEIQQQLELLQTTTATMQTTMTTMQTTMTTMQTTMTTMQTTLQASMTTMQANLRADMATMRQELIQGLAILGAQ